MIKRYDIKVKDGFIGPIMSKDGFWVKYNDIKDNLIEWHSVEEEPKEKIWYWLWIKGNYFGFEFWNGNGFGKDTFHCREDILMWAIPKPPKGEI